MIKKQTQLTIETLEKSLLPKIGILIDKRLNERFGKFEGKIDVKLANWKYDIDEKFDDLKQEIKHLPNKEEFYAEEDKVVTELKNLRDEVVVTHHLYEKTNKRVDIVDKNLGIDTSVVF